MGRKRSRVYEEEIMQEPVIIDPERAKDPNCIEYWHSIEIPVEEPREPTLEENIATAHAMLPWCFEEFPKGCKRDRTYFMEEVMKYLTIELQQLAEVIQNVEQEYHKIILENTPEVA